MKTQGTVKIQVRYHTENRDAVKVCTPIARASSLLSTVTSTITLGAELRHEEAKDERA